jgi:hypothetical protein
VVPAVEYQASKRFRLLTSRSSSPIRFGRLIEQQPEWVWTAIEPLDASARVPLAPAPPSMGPPTGSGFTTTQGPRR